MRILIITQKIDDGDPILGFFTEWIVEFSKQAASVVAVSLEKAKSQLPSNVKSLSLGKEKGLSRFSIIFNFYKHILLTRNEYDAVFVHMNPIYVILGFPVWRFMGKGVGLWYVHRAVDFKLRLAESLVDHIFTVAPESFRIRSSKIHFVGHGVSLDRFARQTSVTHRDDGLKIVSVSRISPIKNIDTLIEAAAILKEMGLRFHIDIIGDPIKPLDFEYRDKLVRMIQEKRLEREVSFIGSIPNTDIPSRYWASDLSVNLSPTGGVDKAVLESMAAGTPVLASNMAFTDYFGAHADLLLFRERDAEDCASKIERLSKSKSVDAIASDLLKTVRAKSGLKALISKIIALYETSR